MARWANLYRTSILLGISEPQVTELIKKGELELFLKDSHTPLIEEKSIYKYMERRDSATKNDLDTNNALLNKQLNELKLAIDNHDEQLEIHNLSTEQRLVTLERQVSELAAMQTTFFEKK